jgi:hypothetical protein
MRWRRVIWDRGQEGRASLDLGWVEMYRIVEVWSL